MSEKRHKRQETAARGGGPITGLFDKTVEWYQVYESRLAINLLEPWEKCLANAMVVMLLVLMFYIFTWLSATLNGLLA